MKKPSIAGRLRGGTAGHRSRLSRPAIEGFFAALLLATTFHVAPLHAATPVNWITFHNTHTNERLEITFRDPAGQFIPEALESLNLILRDHRSQQHCDMDPQLFVLLVDLAASAGVAPEYEVISGYRSPESNEKLRSNGGGQAKNSQHIEGKAIDVRLHGVGTERLRDLARALQRGGVGYYPKSDFVHVDTARVRYWEG